jgi:hypothetical protein
MLKLKKFSQIIFAFSVLGVFVYGLYFIAALIWRSLVQVNPTLAVGVVAAVSTIAVSITSLIFSKYFERKSEIRNEHRQRKTPIYEELIAFIFKILKSVKTNEPMPTEKEIVDFMFDFNQKLIIWGSDEVVTAFSKYRTSVSDPDLIMFAVEDLLLAIRKDLGHNNKNLSNGRLLSIFIDNADVLLNQLKMKKKTQQSA